MSYIYTSVFVRSGYAVEGSWKLAWLRTQLATVRGIDAIG